MSTPPDWDDLARRYLDLWQQNISAAAADPDAARDMARLIGGFGALMGGGGMTAPQPAADASALTAALKDIDRRLAAIERTLHGLADGKGKAASKPARPRKPAAKAKQSKPRAAKRRTGGPKQN